jgi:hypothetical protein
LRIDADDFWKGTDGEVLVTMLPANDLGLPTRLVPIARALADRSHDVAVFNPAPVPAKLIDDAGLKNLPMPSRPMPGSSDDLAEASSAWDVEHMFGALFGNEEFVRTATAANVDVVRDFNPNLIVDSFGLFWCLAARILQVQQHGRVVLARSVHVVSGNKPSPGTLRPTKANDEARSTHRWLGQAIVSMLGRIR